MSRRKTNWDRVRMEKRSCLQGSEKVEPDRQYRAYLAEEWRENAEPSERELDRFGDSLLDDLRRKTEKALIEKVQEEHPATKRN